MTARVSQNIGISCSARRSLLAPLEREITMKAHGHWFRSARRSALRSAFSVLAGVGGGAAAAGALGACDEGEPASPTVAAAAEASVTTPAPTGAQLVQARGCAKCHQASDSTYGVLSGQTVPRPGTSAYGRNLTPDEQTGIGAWTDEAILRAIRFGLDEQGSPLCATMPDFSDMGEAEGAAIVAYLRSLRPVKREIPESRCADTASDAGPADSSAAPREGGPGGDPAEPTDVVDGSTTTADDAGADACALSAPNVPGDCHGCTVAASCNPNGCYRGYWCAPATHTCHRKPTNCH
jgi:hypothetical protein